MLKGMTAEEKKKLGLSKATDYNYLTIVSTVSSPSSCGLCWTKYLCKLCFYLPWVVSGHGAAQIVQDINFKTALRGNVLNVLKHALKQML